MAPTFNLNFSKLLTNPNRIPALHFSFPLDFSVICSISSACWKWTTRIRKTAHGEIWIHLPNRLDVFVFQSKTWTHQSRRKRPVWVNCQEVSQYKNEQSETIIFIVKVEDYPAVERQSVITNSSSMSYETKTEPTATREFRISRSCIEQLVQYLQSRPLVSLASSIRTLLECLTLPCPWTATTTPTS